MIQSFYIKCVLPGLNEIIDEARKNKFASAKLKKAFDKVAFYAIKEAKIKPVESARFSFIWYETSKRRNPDNIMTGQKFIFDALVKAGIIKNDGWSEVVSIKHDFMVNKEDPGVLVKIIS